MAKQSMRLSRVNHLSRRSGTSENSSSGSNMNIHHRPSSKVQPTRLIKRKLNDGQPSGQSLVSSDASHIGCLELSMYATKSVENGEGGKLIGPQEDMHYSSEGHSQVQPLEQLQHLVDAGSAQTEHASRDAVPSSPNSLVANFPSIPENISVWPNLDLPNLSFHGTYSSSNNTTGATSPDQEQILADFFQTHPTVQAHINGLPESFQLTQHLATLLYHLKFVTARDFDEAARAQVQEAWNGLIGAGCELQDLKPAVVQALNAEETRRKREELTATIQACQEQLDNLPLQNPDEPFLQL